MVPLSLDDELIYDLRWDSDHQLSQVSLHYRGRMEGRWVEVCRYDNAHGTPHVHKFWLAPPVQSLAPDLPPQDFLERGEEDLFQNWQAYRKSMEAKL